MQRSRIVVRDDERYAKFGDGFYFTASNRPANVSFETPLFGEGHLEIHFCVSGELRLAGSWGEVAVVGPRLLFWYLPPGQGDVTEELIGTDKGYAGLSLYCDRRWLVSQALGRDKTINKVWDEYVGRSPTTPQFRLLPLTGDSDRIVRSILDEPGDESLDYLQLKGRAFELFALAISAHVEAQGGQEVSRYKESEIHKVSAAREFIYSNFANPPTIKELARAVGLNTTRLMECFKYQYGETIRGMVIRLRMEEARRLLLTTDMLISSVAYKVGYEHLSSFSAAFSDHFGVSPKKLAASRSKKR